MAQISEKKRVDYVRPTCTNPYFIRWRNRYGGWESFLFEGNKTLTKRITQSIVFQQRIEHLNVNDSGQKTTGGVKVASKEDVVKILLTADNLTEQKRDGLLSLFSSMDVYLLMNPTTWSTAVGPTWEQIIIEPGSLEIGDTHQDLFSLNFTIQRQPEFNTSQ